MKIIRLTITSELDSTCRRTVELSGEHSLWELHRIIQSEFELDGDHLWAFYLSGDCFDAETAFGPRDRTPEVKLRDLSFAPLMEFVYLYDFGDELRHRLRVEAVDEVTASVGLPRVINRVGVPPNPQNEPDEYDDRDEDNQESYDRTDVLTSDDEEEKPENTVAFSDDILVDARAAAELSDDFLDEEPSAARRQRTVDLLGKILATCSNDQVLTALCEAADVDLKAVMPDLLHDLREHGDDEAIRDLEAKWARLPIVDEHGHNFSPELIADVRWAAVRMNLFAESTRDRVAAIPPDELYRICDAVMNACGHAGRLAELECQSDTSEVSDLLEARVAVSAPRLSQAALQELLLRTERVTGTNKCRLLAADSLHGAGLTSEARTLLKEAPPDGGSPFEKLKLADAFRRIEALEEAEALYRELLQQRWLSGRIRPDVVAGLIKLLRTQSRLDEVRSIEKAEVARQTALRAELSGTIVRKGEKVGRNDPCPCGSGNKAKNCCGVAA